VQQQQQRWDDGPLRVFRSATPLCFIERVRGRCIALFLLPVSPSCAPLFSLPWMYARLLVFARAREVKCVVHWFQMMYSGHLSMFADGPASQYVPVTYDVARVSCPVAIVYGGSDHLGKPPDVRAV